MDLEDLGEITQISKTAKAIDNLWLTFYLYVSISFSSFYKITFLGIAASGFHNCEEEMHSHISPLTFEEERARKVFKVIN